MVDVHLGPLVKPNGLPQRLAQIGPAVARPQPQHLHAANDAAGAIDIEAPVDVNLRNIAHAKHKDVDDLTVITGQRPKVNRARKSIANFKLREGMPVGVSVTLRGDRMWEFLDRLTAIALPRIRDFRGVKPSFDGRGNFAMGLKEHIVFPEINFDKVDEVWGMDVIICTTANTDAEAKALLKHFNMPFNS